MIEMKRRRSTRCHSDPEVAPMPSFEDIDRILNTSGILADNATVGNNPSVPDKNSDNELKKQSKVDVSYFRNLIQMETQRLTMLCAVWRSTMEDLSDLGDEVRGSIRTTIGQAELLMAERFKQFAGLVDNCEFGTGLKKVTTSDLQGFWDMIYFQVEDVNAKFGDLDKLKAADWVTAKQSPVKPKLVKKKKKAAAAGPAAAVPGPRSNFAEFRRQMKLKQKAVAAEATSNDVVNASPQRLATPPKLCKRTPSSGKKLIEGESGKNRDSPRTDVLRRSFRKSLLVSSPLVNKAHQSTPASLPATEHSASAEVVMIPPVMDSANSAGRKPLRSILHNPVASYLNVSDTVNSEHLSETNSGSRKKTSRKSVCFVKTATPVNMNDSSFLKYLQPTQLSGGSNSAEVATPEMQAVSLAYIDSHSMSLEVAMKTPTLDSGRQSTPNTLQKATPNSGPKTTTSLVDISGDSDGEDDVAVCQFGHLKVGFTPGVDGKSRRISGFSPAVRNGTPVTVMSALDEENVDLIKFSPTGRRSSVMPRRQTLRRSTRVSSIARALVE